MVSPIPYAEWNRQRVLLRAFSFFNRSKECAIMETQIINAIEYRNVSLSLLSESQTNPDGVLEENALKELAAAIRIEGYIAIE
jgi:hypothetical protein